MLTTTAVETANYKDNPCNVWCLCSYQTNLFPSIWEVSVAQAVIMESVGLVALISLSNDAGSAATNLMPSVDYYDSWQSSATDL